MSSEIRNLEEVIAKLRGLGRADVLFEPMTKAASHLVDRLAKYPPQVSRPQPFKTDKQRRFFFAALRDGRIQVPYRRTGTLGRKWTSDVAADGSQAVVGNNTPYGPLVMGTEKQARYHAQGGWRRVDQVARIEERRVRGFFEAAYTKYTNS